MSDTILGEVVQRTDTPIEGEVGNPVYLIVGGEEFLCRRVAVTWQLMRFAVKQRDAKVSIPSGLKADDPKRKALEAKKNDAGMELLAIMYETIMTLLHPRERERFEEFMNGTALMPNELESAIGDVISRIGGDEKKEQPTTSVFSESDTTTSESVQVLSFERKPQKATRAKKSSTR